MHLDGMREDGLPIPEPPSIAEYIEISRHKKGTELLDLDDKVAGIFQMPSAESPATSEVSKGSGYGTWNVPATLENDE